MADLLPFNRLAKIVCTIGPSSEDPSALRQLVEAGMDVARLNFSHGQHHTHERTIATLRSISRELGRPVAVLQDLQGPKLRTGAVADGAVELRTGDPYTLTAAPVEGDREQVSTNFPELSAHVSRGDQVLLRDGLLRLIVEEIAGGDIRCRVEAGGLLMSRSGINIPGTTPDVRILTEKDREDLRFGLRNGVDFVAVSFIRRAAD